MIAYAIECLDRQVRASAIGFLVAFLGASSILVPVAHAASPLPNPGFGTILAVQADTGSVVSVGAEAPVVEQHLKALKTIYMASTAYTSRVEECDSDPFVTADGSEVRDGIVATNVLPFGTKVRIPTVFGDRIFEVHDRMNARYSYRVDIWMKDIKDARAYGLKRNIPIEVVEWGNNSTQWQARADRKKMERAARGRVEQIALGK